MNPMLLSLFSPISRGLHPNFRRIFSAKSENSKMGRGNLSLIQKGKHATVGMTNVRGYNTDLLEIRADDPKFSVVFIPGNPGVVSFYTDFLESLFELLGGTATVTGIGHISHSGKCWEPGKKFTLQEQIDHKISFIEQELQDNEIPVVLVGHSIGAYISLEIFKRLPVKVMYCVCLYPFLAVNTLSNQQSSIRRIAASPAICVILSCMGALLGMLPAQISTFLVRKSIGSSWSSSAVEVFYTHVLQYHTVRNILFMAMTEFEKLVEKPDWEFIGEKKSQIAFLFGADDHWGPLHLYEEIRNRIPDACVAIEREGHTHAFSCTEAGSTWAAHHVSTLIKNHVPSAKNPALL